jgi:multicomponent Na+:H+ antiporter subunit B
MNRTVRVGMFLVAAVGFAAFLVVGMWGLEPFGVYAGPYGDVINASVVPERHATNSVTAINFDYRGFDTLGEEFILFAAVAGVMVLLREGRGESESSAPGGDFGRVRQPRSEAVRLAGVVMIALINLVGVYIVIHAQLTPGGGFQGGAIFGTASLLAYLASRYQTYRRILPKSMLDAAEAIGAGMYALIGIGTVVAGGAFLENILPLGSTRTLLSSGTIPLINLAVGLEVAAGFAMLFEEFLEETRAAHPGDDES